MHSEGQDYTFSFAFTPVGYEAGDMIPFFPYIGEDRRLHLWDTVKTTNIYRRSIGSRSVDGFDAEEVRKRWPKLFQFAQEDGFWWD